jgi:hypothetical protein
MIQSTTNCIRFATVMASLVTVELFLPSVWSLSISHPHTRPCPEWVQVSAQTITLHPALPGLGLELPVSLTSGHRLLDDGTQDEVVPAVTDSPRALANQDQSEETVDFLMRAPMHEAFAEIPLSKPLPNPVVERQPPEAIDELPPDYKPEGDNIVWIPGYWFWDEEREDFIWVSGVWRDAPEGQQWMEGYWHEETDANNVRVGFRWVNGFWQNAETTSLQYLPQPPDPIEVGPSMPAPSEDYFYVPGTWLYQQSRYVWRPGYYSVYIEDLVWVPPCYVWTPCGYLFRPGYWDKPIQERGVVFAPIYFREPVYLQPNYVFQPTCVIDTGLAILPHLFIRRNRCHYYYGDWYADRYLNYDFCSWSNLGNHGFYHRQYDPLFNYYSAPMARFHNRSIVHWAGRQHRHCASHFGLRPPIVFNLSIINQQFSNHQHNHLHNQQNLDQLPTSQVFLGDSLGRRAKLGTLNSLDPKAQRFVQIDARQQKNEAEAIDRQLQKQRRDAERKIVNNQREKKQDKLVQPTQVPIVPTALQMDPTRQAQVEKDAARRRETQQQIQQKQAQAAIRAQARKLKNDQPKTQDSLEAMAQDRRPSQNGSPGNPIVKALPPAEARDSQPKRNGGKSLNLPSTDETVNQPVDRQLGAEQRQRTLQMNQQEREQRRQMEAAQRLQEAAQRRATEARKRQQPNGQVWENQPFDTPATQGTIDQRQFRASESQQTLQLKQQERAQRRQMDAAQRQQEAAQRQQEAAQRQATDAMKRPQPNGQLMGNQPFHDPSRLGQVDNQMERQLRNEQRQRALQMNQQESEQRRQVEAAQRQSEAAQRQREAVQRQAHEAMKRQQIDAARQAQDTMRQQKAQLEAQQRQVETMRRQVELQQRQAQEAGRRQEAESRRAMDEARRQQEREQRQQERDKKN